MQKYITIKEACRLTGKSESTIRRLLRQLAGQKGSHLTRQIVKKEITVTGFIYKISKKFILSKIGSNDQLMNSQNDQPDQPNDQPKILQKMVEILKEQLETKDIQLSAKDKQIEELNKTINQMVERDRETNILLKNFQEKTFLLESSEQKNILHKTTTKPKEKKKDFLSMLFGR